MAYKPRILVVEDDKATLRQLQAILHAMGAAPHCVETSREAAQILNKEKFDGVFLNWDMPELDGETLTRMIRGSKSNANVPVAMLTGSQDTKAIARGFKVGVTFFLSKPVGPKELSRLLNASRGAMLAERRKYERVPARIRVHCTWGEKKVVTESLDISASGMRLSLAPPPKVGEILTVEFSLPRSQEIFSLKAEVARVASENQVGVKFFRLTTTQRQQLEAFASQAKPPG